MDTAARRLENVPLDDLVAADVNPKDHVGDVIEASIDRFGFVEIPTIDERTGKLLAGHGRKDALVAARDRGEDPPDGVTVDDAGVWLVPTLRGVASIDDDEAAAYLVASNQTTIAGGWLPDLGPMLDELRSRRDDALVGVGFTDDDVDRMLSEGGWLSEQRGAFLDDLAGDSRPDNPMASTTELADGMVELRFAMTPEERTEVIVALRSRMDSATNTLAGALLALVRT